MLTHMLRLVLARILNSLTLSPIVTTMALALMTASARADTAAPQPNLLKAPPVWLGLLVMFVLLAMVITVSLMPSRRSHLD